MDKQTFLSKINNFFSSLNTLSSQEQINQAIESFWDLKAEGCFRKDSDLYKEAEYNKEYWTDGRGRDFTTESRISEDVTYGEHFGFKGRAFFLDGQLTKLTRKERSKVLKFYNFNWTRHLDKIQEEMRNNADLEKLKAQSDTWVLNRTLFPVLFEVEGLLRDIGIPRRKPEKLDEKLVKELYEEKSLGVNKIFFHITRVKPEEAGSWLVQVQRHREIRWDTAERLAWRLQEYGITSFSKQDLLELRKRAAQVREKKEKAAQEEKKRNSFSNKLDLSSFIK